MLALVFAMTAATAQTGRNAKVTVVMNTMNYKQQEQKKHASSSDLVNVLLEALGMKHEKAASNSTSYQDAVRAAIVKGLAESYRISAIDGMGATANCDYKVDATVANLSTTTKVMENRVDGKIRKVTEYKGLVNMTLQVKDAKTGRIVDNPTINISALDVAWTDTPQKAIVNALKELTYSVSKHFNKWLPLTANVLDGASVKKDKQKEVYIDLGTDEGAVKGVHFDVYSVKNVAGREAKSKIGRLKIEDVEGNDISLCKITSGGKAVKSALESGGKLVVVSNEY